jgi:hypothetical protein
VGFAVKGTRCQFPGVQIDAELVAYVSACGPKEKKITFDKK